MANQLKKSTSLFGAIVIGLGSILGTGAYVSVGLSAQLAENWLLLAILLAGITAIFNGLSSAQLASAHPVSGGTYEYGYQYLSPRLGRMAGWLFVTAKSASAATGALAVGWYIGHLFGLPDGWHRIIALLLVACFTLLVSNGITRTNRLNLALVFISITGLLAFSIFGFITLPNQAYAESIVRENSTTLYAVLQASALMFVAYTGYGRIATMGEEVDNPRYTIPRAVVITLSLSGILYCAVGASILTLNANGLIDKSTQMHLFEMVSGHLGQNSYFAHFIAFAATCAMAGVVLNLILGVSRVILAMGRRGDLPKQVSFVNQSQTSPTIAVCVTGVVIAFILLSTDIKLAWSVSAFTVLLYYTLTNIAALFVPPIQRFVPKWVSLGGLVSCLLLSVFVSPLVLMVGVFCIVCFFFLDYLLAH